MINFPGVHLCLGLDEASPPQTRTKIPRPRRMPRPFSSTGTLAEVLRMSRCRYGIFWTLLLFIHYVSDYYCYYLFIMSIMIIMNYYEFMIIICMNITMMMVTMMIVVIMICKNIRWLWFYELMYIYDRWCMKYVLGYDGICMNIRWVLM